MTGSFKCCLSRYTGPNHRYYEPITVIHIFSWCFRTLVFSWEPFQKHQQQQHYGGSEQSTLPLPQGVPSTRLWGHHKSKDDIIVYSCFQLGALPEAPAAAALWRKWAVHPAPSTGRTVYTIMRASQEQRRHHSVQSRFFKRLWSPGIDSKEWIPPAYLRSLAGRYDNPIPFRFLAPIDCLKIPAQWNLQRSTTFPCSNMVRFS